MKAILVVVSILLVNSFLPCYSLEDDVACLKGVKSSLTDPEERLGQWDLANRSVASICKLVGVSCWNEKENRLISLQLLSMELVGMLPESLKFCHSLQSLDLSGNALSGSIPPQICNWLPYLVTLDLSGNALSGSIPPEIVNWRVEKSEALVMVLAVVKGVREAEVEASSEDGRAPWSLQDNEVRGWAFDDDVD